MTSKNLFIWIEVNESDVMVARFNLFNKRNRGSCHGKEVTNREKEVGVV